MRNLDELMAMADNFRNLSKCTKSMICVEIDLNQTLSHLEKICEMEGVDPIKIKECSDGILKTRDWVQELSSELFRM